MAKYTFFVVVETPKGSTQKYDYDEKYRYFTLKKILPAGMMFPFDFGFIPDTKGQDGDPLDAFVLSTFRTFPGCMVKCRLLGAIKAEQREKDGKTVRNDRYIMAPIVSGGDKASFDAEHFLPNMLKELEAFFINYNKQEGKEFRPLGSMDSKEASKQIKKFRR